MHSSSFTKSIGSIATSSLTKFKLRGNISGDKPVGSNKQKQGSSKSTFLCDDSSINCRAIDAAIERRQMLQEEIPESLRMECDTRCAEQKTIDCVAPFTDEEILLGRLLGEGEFAHVYEITSFQLKTSLSKALLRVIDDDSNEESSGEDIEEDLLSEGKKLLNLTPRECKRRLQMKKVENYRQSGTSRYALKHLKESYLRDHDEERYIQAAGDLAVEAEFLSSLTHPHIIKLRGMVHAGAEGFGRGPSGYFLIIDRLSETLDKRIQRWGESSLKNSREKRVSFFRRRTSLATDEANGTNERNSISGGKGRRRPSILDSLKRRDDCVAKAELSEKDLDERLEIALQISAALVYLHKHHIIFRDLKPMNIGFDCRGDVKIFDFGLARIMPEEGDPNLDLFEMSGAGSPRYMAPELLRFDEYNLKADVYSLTIILWEMLSGERAFEFVRSRGQLIRHVTCDNGRPAIDDNWPVKMKALLGHGFDVDVGLRPTMSVFHESIKRQLSSVRGQDRRKLTNKFINRRRSVERFGASLNSEPLTGSFFDTEKEEDPAFALSVTLPHNVKLCENEENYC